MCSLSDVWTKLDEYASLCQNTFIWPIAMSKQQTLVLGVGSSLNYFDFIDQVIVQSSEVEIVLHHLIKEFHNNY